MNRSVLGPPAGDAVIDVEGFAVPRKANQHGGLTEGEPPVLGMPLRTRRKGDERAFIIARGMAAVAEELGELGVAFIKGDCAFDDGHRFGRPPPTEQSRAEHFPWPRPGWSDLDGGAIGPLGLVIVALEFPQHPDANARRRIPGPERLRASKGVAGLRVSRRPSASNAQPPPGLRVFRVLVRGPLEVGAGTREGAVFVGANAEFQRRASAPNHDRGHGQEHTEKRTERLTVAAHLTRIRPMTRETLLEIARRAHGTEASGSIKFSEDHEVSFYLGEPGQAMAVRRVSECKLEKDFVEITALDPEAHWYVAYDAVFGLASKPSKDRSNRRAGF